VIRRLRDRYNVQDESLRLVTGGDDPAYSACIWLTDKAALSFHVSLLGPYYGIHIPGIPADNAIAPEIAREIEATYPGYRQIPPQIGNEAVPVGHLDVGLTTVVLDWFSSMLICPHQS
jgi:hypothetical protein